ncbi:hypothetical protein OXX80_009332 [Metschnikowia pulcherrima]
MGESYTQKTPRHIVRGAKIFALLAFLRVPNSASWAAFLSLNSIIKNWLQNNVKLTYKDPATVTRRISKLANLVSAGFLYSAISTNSRMPKDYISLCLIESYYGQLVPPTSPLNVSPTTSSLRDCIRNGGWMKNAYVYKHLIVFPLLCGQLLSTYLTPTKYRPNQRYFPRFIRNHVLDPIWKHFRLDRKGSSLNWRGVLSSYAKDNGYLFMYMAISNFRHSLLTPWLRSTSGDTKLSLTTLLKRFVGFSAGRANAVANMIYSANLLSMFLLSVTSSILIQNRILKNIYMAHEKSAVKVYMKIVGYVAGLCAMSIHSVIYSEKPISKKDSERGLAILESNGTSGRIQTSPSGATQLDASFYNSLSLYLSQLLVLSKWRILKENHPWFSVLNVGTWRRMEAGLMCFVVWKMMNLNDHVTRVSQDSHAKKVKNLKHNVWLKMVDRIM